MNVWLYFVIVAGVMVAFWLGTKVPALLMLMDYLRKGSGR